MFSKGIMKGHHLQQGFFGLLFSVSPLIPSSPSTLLVQSENPFLQYLPCWGYVCATFNFLENAVSLKNNPNRSNADYIKFLLNIISNVELSAVSHAAFKPGSLDLIYSGFSINAGISFAIAAYDYLKFWCNNDSLRSVGLGGNRKKNIAFKNVLVQGASCLGWSLLASGHPAGWLFIGAKSIYHLFEVNPSCCGLFGNCWGGLSPPSTPGSRQSPETSHLVSGSKSSITYGMTES